MVEVSIVDIKTTLRNYNLRNPQYSLNFTKMVLKRVKFGLSSLRETVSSPDKPVAL